MLVTQVSLVSLTLFGINDVAAVGPSSRREPPHALGDRRLNEVAHLEDVEDVFDVSLDAKLAGGDVGYRVAQMIHEQHVLVGPQSGLVDGQAGLSGNCSQRVPWLRLRAIDLSLMSCYELPKDGLFGACHRGLLGAIVSVAKQVFPIARQHDALERVGLALTEVFVVWLAHI